MYQCLQCGQQNQAAYKFCLGCGAEAPKREREPSPYRSAGEPAAGQVRCMACGTMNAPHYAFCLSCAQRLQQPEPTPGPMFRDFAPRLAYALYIAHQNVTTRPDRHAHVAIIAGTILAVARAIQSGVAPSQAVVGDAASLAIRDGTFGQDDPLVVAYGQVFDFCRRNPRDDAGLAVAAADPDLAGRAQALADALRTR